MIIVKYNYARLDINKICKGIFQAVMPLEERDLISIDDYDTELLGKKYENGEFRELEPDERQELFPESPDLTETQIIMLALAEIYEKLEGAK